MVFFFFNRFPKLWSNEEGEHQYNTVHDNNTILRQTQNCHYFADNVLKNGTFLNENVWITLYVSMKVNPEIWINIIQAFFQIMAWCQSGDNSLSEPMIWVYRHLCITLPQWAILFLTWYNEVMNYDHMMIFTHLLRAWSMFSLQCLCCGEDIFIDFAMHFWADIHSVSCEKWYITHQILGLFTTKFMTGHARNTWKV